MNNLIDILSQQSTSDVILLAVSLLGGIIASISPCTLGILPIIIGYVVGYGDKSTARTFAQMLSFILGMALVLTTLGLICAIGGKLLINRYAAYFAIFVGSIILIMGLNLIGILNIQMPVFIKEMPQSDGKGLFLYPMLIGCTFALASTPCSTPILAGIMSFASLRANLVLAAMMLFLFAIGQGLVIVIAGVFTSVLKGLRAISQYTEILMKISGILLVVVSFVIYWRVFSSLF